MNQVFKPDQRRIRSEITRENILDAALHCYQKKGVDGAAMEDVARQASVSRATLYRHFGNQEELLTSVVARNMEQLQRAIRSSLTGCSRPEEFFVESMLVVIRECHRHSLTAFLLTDDASVSTINRITFSPSMIAMGNELIEPFYRRTKAEGILKSWVTKSLLQEWTSRLLLSFLSNPSPLLNTETKMRKFFYDAIVASIIERAETE